MTSRTRRHLPLTGSGRPRYYQGHSKTGEGRSLERPTLVDTGEVAPMSGPEVTTSACAPTGVRTQKPLSTRDELLATWDELDRYGAVVERVDLIGFEPFEVELLLMHEQRRVRALGERLTPRPAPIDWSTERYARRDRARGAARFHHNVVEAEAARRRREAA